MDASTPLSSQYVRKDGQKPVRAEGAIRPESGDVEQKAAALNISARTVARINEVPKGYYIIVGVYRDATNVDRLIGKLKARGLNAGRLLNPENGMYYVYADKFEEGATALEAANTKLYGKYPDALWILIVSNDPERTKVPETSEPVSLTPAPAVEAPAGIVLSSETYAAGIPVQSSDPAPEAMGSNQLLRKANLYFERMWYADAAGLYELVLSRNPELTSPELLEKVGDAHYFNSNMEEAYQWYEQLYELEEEELSADYLYKYAQSLKGTGKYGRARRFLKLYDKKLNETPLWRHRYEEVAYREILLENLLTAEDIFSIRNLDINSEYSDFGPMFYGDDQIVYASSVDSAFFKTRRYKWNDQPYLDLYVARMNQEDSGLQTAVKFSRKINTKYHEAAVTFSPDHMTMYFTRNNYGKKLRRDRRGINHLKIYRSQKLNGEWTEAEELPFNGEDFSTGHPALSPDGKKLYFVSDRPGTIGNTDIFVVDVNEDGSFSAPKNLGAEINTEQQEMFPFIKDDKIYFSSNGHVGLGGLDVFQASILEDGGYGDLQNVGKPVNSQHDDFSFIIDPETQKGYFASNRQGGKGDDDLYSFQRLIPEEVNENAIAGVVTDLVSEEVLPEAFVQLLDENNMVLREMSSDTDGSFVFEELDSNTRYRIRVEKADYIQAEQDVETLDNEIVSTEIALDKLEERIVVEDGIKKIRTDNIYFDFDKFSIREDAAAELDELAGIMRDRPTMVIRIESHTDSRGSAAYNKYLSDNRARATRDYLIRKGIDPARIESAVGFGEERLLNGCDGTIKCSAEAHELNRRSEFIIVRM